MLLNPKTLLMPFCVLVLDMFNHGVIVNVVRIDMRKYHLYAHRVFV